MRAHQPATNGWGAWQPLANPVTARGNCMLDNLILNIPGGEEHIAKVEPQQKVAGPRVPVDITQLQLIVKIIGAFGPKCAHCGQAGHSWGNCPLEQIERAFAKALGCFEAYKAVKKMAYGAKAEQDPARECGGDGKLMGPGVPKPFGSPLLCMLQHDMQTADRMVQLSNWQKGKEVCRVVTPQTLTSPYRFLKPPTYLAGSGSKYQAQGGRGYGQSYGNKFGKGNDGASFRRGGRGH